MTLYGLRCIQKPSDIKNIAKNVVQKVTKMRDDLFKSEEKLPEALDDISYTICSLIDPLECARNTHWNPQYRDAASEVILMIQPLMLQLNSDADIPLHIGKTLERFDFHGEDLAILKSSLNEYHNYGVGMPVSRNISEIHSKLTFITDEYSKSSWDSGKNHRQSTLLALVTTRWKLARSLGYSSYSRLFLKEKLLDSPEAVEKFLDSRIRTVQPLSDYQFTGAFKKPTGYSWNSLRSICLQVLSFAKSFYGLNSSIILETTNNVMKIRVDDIDSGKYMGTIYADLKERVGKCLEPSHFTILGSKRFVKNCPVTGIRNSCQRPIVYISCNIENAAELSFDEISTLFHEFGHAFHAIMSETKFQMLSGTRCSLDFAEVPSVLFEKVAGLWSTMAAMGCPEEIRQRFKWWRVNRNNFTTQRDSLKIAIADQLIHNDSPPKTVNDLNEVCRKAENIVDMSADCEEWLSEIGHLSNYGSCYYSYLLADSISDKVISRYQIDKFIGNKLRVGLLSKGGTVSPVEQLDALGINILN